MKAGAGLRLEGLSKSFGTVVAVSDVTLDIAPGSFVTLLGPSGSGKTTTLNLLAGFLFPDAGEVYFDDQPMSGVPPNKRDIGMVFQSYALFPHMTVFDNVAFPMRMRSKLGAEELRGRVAETLALVQLGTFGDRFPRQLSGGQQQRVAMARALVSRPRLLLMDEPLGALDKKLREQLQIEMKAIHRSVGSTFVYVTHDQSEALTMSDTVVVMNEGRVAQVGAPQTLYRSPKSVFVADFLGGANILTGKVTAKRGEYVTIDLDGGATVTARGNSITVHDGMRVSVVVRPEDVDIAISRPSDAETESLAGEIVEFAYLGDSAKVLVAVNESTFTVKLAASRDGELTSGQAVFVRWPRSAAWLLDPAAEDASP